MKVIIGKYPKRLSLYGWTVDLFGRGKISNWMYSVLETPFYVKCTKTVEWVQDRVSTRKVVVKVDPWDTWNADETLARVILPVLKQIKDNKQGIPMSMFMAEDFSDCKEAEARWQDTLCKMILAFEAILAEYDRQDQKLSDEEIDEGLALFGKHYRTLWE